jgi:hypothetical protein
MIFEVQFWHFKMGSYKMSGLEISSLQKRVFLLRGRRVMLDSDLARLYGVETKYLRRAVKRNEVRFPGDFMFELSKKEHQGVLESISAVLGHGGSRVLPLAFTQEGVAMLSGVLNSEKAVEVNIAIMRTFVQLREMVESNYEFASQLAELEKKYDGQFQVVFEVLDQLLASGQPPTQKKIKPIDE